MKKREKTLGLGDSREMSEVRLTRALNMSTQGCKVRGVVSGLVLKVMWTRRMSQ